MDPNNISPLDSLVIGDEPLPHNISVWKNGREIYEHLPKDIKIERNPQDEMYKQRDKYSNNAIRVGLLAILATAATGYSIYVMCSPDKF